MPTVHSFDVFDTVLTRQVGAPDAVIDVLSKRLESAGALPVRAAVFAAARKRFETELTGTLGRHATLREIHRAVSTALSTDEAVGDAWAAAEEDLERNLTVPVPGALERIASARAAGRVVFVSDTPHREAFLASLLVQHGLAQPEDSVFTSSERGVSKSHGGLFQVVTDAVGGDPVLHVGDNARSDVAAASVEGSPGTLVSGGQLFRVRAAAGAQLGSDGRGHLLAGRSLSTGQAGGGAARSVGAPGRGGKRCPRTAARRVRALGRRAGPPARRAASVLRGPRRRGDAGRRQARHRCTSPPTSSCATSTARVSPGSSAPPRPPRSSSTTG